MSRIINISGLTPIEDPSYRYKMPTVVGKIEGRGNGIKTVIVNISELALSLHRDAGEVNKFFGCEMGAQTTFNEEDDRAVVNGAHSDMEMQQCVHKYIEKFVLCPNCGLPETTYSIKQGCIWHRCAACGAKEMVDMNHKLTTYILSQDKKNKKEKAKAKAEKAKEDKENGSEEDKKKKKKKDKGSDDEKVSFSTYIHLE
jgi:translation initiation factor 5